MLKSNQSLLFLLIIFGCVCISWKDNHSPVHDYPQRDIFSPGVFSTARIEGVVGQKMKNCVENGVMSKNYDLLVSDIEMPNMNGLDLTSKVRETSSLKNLPVILVTGLAKDEDKERGIKAGANAYILKKSFDQSVLIETINFLLEKKDN